ncbi:MULTISPECIES: 50S ribosomal protein L25/general stress protein Ctc [Lysobacter]|jgi:large subunit ribosomal protein L25|uniref:Large ribosomal subunit protein bL25 n=1 Tax=Lysobacter soli TaxID=453783 RepID=A0A3D8V906_9GAMM|nr:50S ribosomal protein L25/general stress protein Ctc [Lysobacter soli]MDG2516696.1 50S ribosomal protein L25/general stress protein Ctc [Lysobacter soli]RDY65876.1 50S ribosomal protein L25/general stress protein Ctc [Lysobacter soli]UTA53944.1 50S ribosomal protein L25/general stress protein Ctc [Lysobacter soli]
MSEHTLKATGRKVEGKGASRRLRHAASIPAIVYGGKSEPKAIQLDHEKIWLAQQNEWFYSSILNLDIDGTTEAVLLRDIQRHPFKQIIMHLDFQRVDLNAALKASVPLHFIGQEGSPAGKSADVVITHELNEVTVSCLPRDLPEFIEIDLSNLKVGDIVHLSDVKLPKGVELPELKLGKEHDVAVVIAKHGRVEAEETAEAPSAEVPATKAAKKDEK